MSKSLYPASDPTVRKSGIGGSDLAALFNLDDAAKYGHDVHSLWMQKCGLLIPEDISQKGVIKRGNKLEPLIADEFAEEKKLKLIHSTETFRGDQPWMMAHPDRLFMSKQKNQWGLEIKTAAREVFIRNVFNGLDFGYLLQSVYYLYITKAEGWVLRMKHPDSWDDHDFIIRRNADTDQVWARILDRGSWFWNLVKTKTEPPAEKEVKLPEITGGKLTQTDTEEWRKVGRWLQEAEAIHKSSTETLEMAKTAVALLMQDNGWDIVEGPVSSGLKLRCYHQPQKGRVTFKGREALALLSKISELVQMDQPKAIGELMAGFNETQFIKQGKPSKPFRKYWVKNRPAIKGE